MNIVKKLTLRHLGKNMSRTVVTTLGICVSVAMITAVFVSIASFLNFFGEVSAFDMGNWHGDYSDVSAEQIAKLKTNSDIESVGLHLSGYFDCSAFEMPNGQANKFERSRIYAGDEANLKQMITAQLDGEIPKNENEIAVEEKFIERNKLDWKIGDTVSIPVGKMELQQEVGIDDNGDEYYYGHEVFREQEIRQFKIVGILYHNNPTYRSGGAIVRGISEEEKLGAVDAAVTLADPNYKSLDLLYEISEEIGVNADDLTPNYDVLDSYFAVPEGGTIATILIPMGLVILLIIIAASVALIYNAFAMSLSEKTRYLGMLGSVGATKRQKKQSVYFEGFVLGAVSILLGTLGGILGIAITLKAVSDIIVSTGMIMGVQESGITIRAVVPVWAIIGIVFFSALTIFISSYIPARKASAITPIEALRQNREFKLKSKKLRTPRYVRFIFGYEGELAHKNLKRNGRKSRVITAAIAISVILFLTANSFVSLFTSQVDLAVDLPYQLEIVANYADKDNLVEKFNGISGVDNVYSVTLSQFYLYPDDEKYDDTLQSDDVLTSYNPKLWHDWDRVALIANIIDDDAFNSLCEANGIDYNEYYGDRLKALLMNDMEHKNGGSKVFNENAVGKKILYWINHGEEETSGIEIGGLVDYDKDNYVCNLNPHGYLSLYFPESTYFSVTSDQKILLGIETENHAEVYEKINDLKYDEELSIYTYDMVEQFETMNGLAFIINVFTYGFITLITLVTLANIVNTISTSVALRRREFAMLKSVGTTQKGFYKMICLESLFYGLKALVFGLPISALLSYAMVLAVNEPDLSFKINWLLYIGVIFVVFLIIGFSMLYSVSKLKNDSIVGTLAEDIS